MIYLDSWKELDELMKGATKTGRKEVTDWIERESIEVHNGNWILPAKRFAEKKKEWGIE